MSENLILNWARSLPPAARRHLAARVLAHAGAPASTLLAAFAEAVGLTPDEVAGLLPGGLVQAQVAAIQLVTVDGRHPAAVSVSPPASF